MANEKIILYQADVDLQGAEEQTAAYKQQLADLKKELLDLKQADKENTAEYVKKSAAAKALASEIRTLENNQAKLIQANNAETGSIKQMEAELSVLNNQWKALSEQKRTDTEEGKKLAQQKLELSEAINKEKLATGDSTNNIGKYETATKSVRQEIKELTAAIIQAKLAGQENTEEVQKQKQRLGELKDAMGDAAAEAKILGSDTKNLDIAVGTFQAIGSAAQIAEGSVALLGGDNEEMTKSIQKMVAIQSILNGVQEIGNALQKESAFMIGLNNVQTKAAAAAQAVYTTAVGASTGAMKLFRTALLATGIGAIIAGIIALAMNWDKLTAAINGSAKAQEDYN